MYGVVVTFQPNIKSLELHGNSVTFYREVEYNQIINISCLTS